MKRELYIGLGLSVLGAVVLYAATRSPAVDESTPVCDTAPPGPQPAVPAGWTMYSGAVSPDATAAARAALSLPIGSTQTFTDSDGSTLGLLLMWHCHDPSSGMTPVGWHKGATLFRVG